MLPDGACCCIIVASKRRILLSLVVVAAAAGCETSLVQQKKTEDSRGVLCLAFLRTNRVPSDLLYVGWLPISACSRSEARAVVLCHLFMGVFVHNSAFFVAPLRKWHPAMSVRTAGGASAVEPRFRC